MGETFGPVANKPNTSKIFGTKIIRGCFLESLARGWSLEIGDVWVEMAGDWGLGAVSGGEVTLFILVSFFFGFSVCSAHSPLTSPATG